MHKPAQYGDSEGREGAALRGFQHPNIAAANDSADGETLRQYLARVGRLPAFQGLALVTQLLSALAFAHRQGRVHGAIHPQQLRVGRTGQLKVEGFDGEPPAAALAPRRGPASEAMPYSAPEQRDGQPSDHRADLYAAAVVAYEVLTGALPFEPGDGHAPDARPGTVRALRPELPVALDAVFERALAHDPGERYPHALELLAALQAALGAPLWERPPVVGSAAVQGEDPPEVPSPLPAAAPILPPPARGLASGSPSRWLGVLLVGLVMAGSLLEGKPPAPDADPAGGMHAGPVQRGLAAPTAQVTSAQPAYPVTSPAKLTLPPLASVPVPDAPAPAGEAQATPASAVEPKPAPPVERPRPAQPAAVREGKPAPRGSPARTSSSRAAEPAPKARPPAAPAAKRRPAPPPSLGCGGGDSVIARQFCIALQCAKAEFQRHPVCVRIHAQQRARNQLAELRGGP